MKNSAYILYMAKRSVRTVKAPFASTFGAKLQEIRIKKGLTQADLAQKLEVPVRKVSYYERFAKNPSLQFVENIAEVLGVDPKHLLNPNSKVKVEEMPSVMKTLKQRIPKLAKLPRKEQESLVTILDGLFAKYKIQV